MNGKEKCALLRQIRQQIAAENEINLNTVACTFEGECRGTCPRCESEVRFLEEQLEKRRNLRKKIALAGISAGLVVSLTGCSVIDAVLRPEEQQTTGIMPVQTEEAVLMGDIAFEDTLEGEVPFEDEVFPAQEG